MSYPMTERNPNALPKTQFVDAERGHTSGGYARLGDRLAPGGNQPPNRPGNSRDSSFLHEATHYDYTKGPEQFRVAKGDIPDNQVGDVDRGK